MTDDVDAFWMKGHWPWCSLALAPVPMNPLCPCQLVSSRLKLLSARWLLTHPLASLPRYQDLPHDAFLDPHEAAWVYLISHRWRSLDHPDVTGLQVALALSSAWCVDRVDTGIWYDYCCLPQGNRTKSEQQDFESGLQELPGLIGSAILVFVVEEGLEYVSRAWCVAESSGHYSFNPSGQAVSTALQLANHPFLGKRLLLADAELSSVKLGHRAGLMKLNEWLIANPTAIVTGSDEHRKTFEEHRSVMGRAAGVWHEVQKLWRQGPISDDTLLNIAVGRGLQCSNSEDVLTCMRTIEALSRLSDNAYRMPE